MSYEANPFADPFSDKAVTQATTVTQKATLEDFNPFGEDGGSSQRNDGPPAVVVPSSPPPPFKSYGTGNPSDLSAPPVAAPAPAPALPGHDELLKRQEELEKKAQELQQREQNLASGNFNPRVNNWPPLPKWFPVGPCFYQDFSIDIPIEFRSTVKMLYYLWIFYVFILFDNVLALLAVYIVDSKSGSQFGLAILWFILFAPLSLCWYRPVYKAFRSDSSFNFFLFFFMMFFQFCFSVLMTVGIPGSGWAGWIVAFGYTNINIGITIYVCVQATLFTIYSVGALILLKKVHSIYRSTGASFEKAQQEFAVGVVKNPGVQTAAASAVQTSMQGTY